MIEGLTKEIEVGTVYTGKVTRMMNFGAFVEMLPGKDGLVHISELADFRVGRRGRGQLGDEVKVMVTDRPHGPGQPLASCRARRRDRRSIGRRPTAVRARKPAAARWRRPRRTAR